MSTNRSPLTDVLHSENHSKLSAEEIAKAVARHNKNHSVAKADNAAAKEKKATEYLLGIESGENGDRGPFC
jgi:hypothetical protein